MTTDPVINAIDEYGRAYVLARCRLWEGVLIAMRMRGYTFDHGYVLGGWCNAVFRRD